MNYRAMARAIRAERRAIWEGLGKPTILDENGLWFDLRVEDALLESGGRVHTIIGFGPFGPIRNVFIGFDPYSSPDEE